MQSQDQPIVFNPSEVLPFSTYRRFDRLGDVITVDWAPSLLHFYESEKFRGVNEELRLEALDCGSQRQITKFTKKNLASWRPDWKRIRGDVLRAGMAMQSLQFRAARRAIKQANMQAMEINNIRNLGGLPGPFLAVELQRFFDQRVNLRRVDRLGVVAIKGSVPDDIASRLDTIYATTKPISAAVYSGSDADHAVEEWCAMNAIPIRRTAEDTSRLRERDAPELVTQVSTLLLCLPDRPSAKAVLDAAKKHKPRLRVLSLGLPASKPA